MPLTRQSWLDAHLDNPVVAGGRDVSGQITQGITPGEFRIISSNARGDDREQALAEFAARMGSPRSDTSGQVLAADTAPELAQELLVPNGIGFPGALRLGANMMRQTAKPITSHVGDSLYEFDQRSRKWSPVVEGKPKEDAATKSRRRILESAIIGGQRGLGSDMLQLMPDRRAKMQAELDLKQAELDALNSGGAGALQQAGVAPEAPLPLGYIGGQGQPNMMQWPAAAGTMTPAMPSAASPVPRLRTATNRKTGQKMVFRDGKWQSLQ